MVQAQAGMFEFRIHPVVSMSREQPVMVNRLVMSLVYYVDEQLKQRTALSPDRWYIMDNYQPEVWMEPELSVFFLLVQPYLVSGVHLEELVQWLGLDVSQTHQKLSCLCQLGFVRLVDSAEIEKAREMMLRQQISEKNNQFQMAAEATDLIRRTGKLLKLLKHPSDKML